MDNDIAFWSTSRQLKALLQGEFTSRQLVELYIERIKQFNPKINAVVSTNFDAARQQADVADAAHKAGRNLGRLHGIPITIKDAIATQGIRSTGGAQTLENNIPIEDAEVVSSLKQQGAIVLGKTNLPTWSADLQSYNSMFGTTNNPWDFSKTPGGSSGGAAAAVASGLSSFEIGTDIGGSIRLPASFCGVFGHKPSWGLLPSLGYLDHAEGGNTEADINVLGPITRSVDDLKLVLDITARKSGPLQAQLAAPNKPVSQMRIAAWLDDGFCPVDKNLLSMMQKCVTKLQDSGVYIDTQARPDIDPTEAVGIGSSLVFAAMSMTADDTTQSLSHKQWLQLDNARQHIRRRWQAFFQEYDAVLMPSCFMQAFDHQHEGDFYSRSFVCNGQQRSYMELTYWAILTGMAYLPATVPPLGLSSNALPVGLQVVSGYGNDLTCLAVAQHISEQSGGYTRPALVLS